LVKRLRPGGRRRQKRQREGARHDEPDKGKRREHEALEHGLDLPNDFCWSADGQKGSM
jgi:hypothetical protein